MADDVSDYHQQIRKLRVEMKTLLDQTDASTCIKSGNVSVSSENGSTGNVSVTNDSTDNVSNLDDGAEATSNALEIRNDVKLCSLDSELNAVKMKNDARCDNRVKCPPPDHALGPTTLVFLLWWDRAKL